MSNQELILEQLRNVNYDKLSKQDIVTMLDAGEQTLENMAASRKTAIDIIAEAMNQTKNTLEALDYSGKVEVEIRKNLSILRELLMTGDLYSPRLGELAQEVGLGLGEPTEFGKNRTLRFSDQS
ncbi:hypothetical protein [Pseudomonas fragi]|uniref:Uncharacterized protein n=2 Tax=Pseudomonas TaxID=286 RepID=A0A449IEQ2_PSEFR|nr:hypothetical protein [Pseudomonas fragi]VFB17750.1 Uncharacterised protein [Pseudomonas fragi]